MGGTLVFDGYPSHGEGGRVQSRSLASFICWDIYFDDIGGRCASRINDTFFCLDRHNMGSNLFSLPLKGGSQRVVVLAATASSHIGTEIWPSQKVVSIKVATVASDFA